MKIGLLIIATGKYNKFVAPLLKSANKHFLNNHQVTFYVFTDDQNILNQKKDNMISLYKEHRPWPFPTLSRYSEFCKYREILSKEDYLFYCDADMLFVSGVSDEVLEDSVATIHPGYRGGRGTPETRKESTAYISPNEGVIYYAGGFNGGAAEVFLAMSEIISKNISIDMENNIIAIWHDESHMNRYFVNNTPTLALSPSYCYPERASLPFEKKILALDKNHKEIRNGDFK
jgi:histo-blood group ABO system transferase